MVWPLASRSWPARVGRWSFWRCFQPGVGLGVFIMGLANLHQLGVYLVAELLGGAVAAMAFKATHEVGE